MRQVPVDYQVQGMAEASGVNISKANTRQQAKRDWIAINIVKVLHKVLYLMRTKMDSKKNKIDSAT